MYKILAMIFIFSTSFVTAMEHADSKIREANRKKVLEALTAAGYDFTVYQEDLAANVAGQGYKKSAKNGYNRLNEIDYQLITEDLNPLSADDLDAVVNERGYTPLLQVVDDGNLELTKLLVEAGANIEARSNTNTTPLIKATRENRLTIMAYLLEKKANINAEDITCRTSLFYAAHQDNYDAVELLLRNGADITIGDCAGYNPYKESKARENKGQTCNALPLLRAEKEKIEAGKKKEDDCIIS